MVTSFGFLSTYPPTQCGLATFTAALQAQLANDGARAGVVRVVETRLPDVTEVMASHCVVAHMVHGQPGAAARAAAVLDTFDVVVIQHEYGIYDGPDGDSVVEVIDHLNVPVIVVAHTVLVQPTAHQRFVLETIARRADAVVTMSATARRRLVGNYDLDESKVVVIPHGAPDASNSRSEIRQPGSLILTWGLLGPGKGIERVIDALPALRSISPTPHYLVVGETHPRVLEQQGEAYRNFLLARAARLGVSDMITFRADYLDVVALRELAASADVVALPYDSHEQVTSGVLIEAVTARRPIVATAFAHAVELLGSGAGIVVDHDDADGLAAALRRILTEPAVAGAMTAQASVLAPDLLWSSVAKRYRELAAKLQAAAVAGLAISKDSPVTEVA